MSTKEEKPTLAGVNVKTRKRNIVVPADPGSFATAIVQIFQVGNSSSCGWLLPCCTLHGSSCTVRQLPPVTLNASSTSSHLPAVDHLRRTLLIRTV
jgi:hypothetical protein